MRTFGARSSSSPSSGSAAGSPPTSQCVPTTVAGVRSGPTASVSARSQARARRCVAIAVGRSATCRCSPSRTSVLPAIQEVNPSSSATGAGMSSSLYGTTSTSARTHASSARAPSTEKQPSASCRNEPPRPSSARSRSAKTQRSTRLVSQPMAVVRDIEPWDALLQAGREDERLVRQAAQHPRAARAGELPDELHPQVADALRARGTGQLWSHQAEALHAAWAGPTIVTTGTASGKSLCFQLPTLDTLCRDARSRAIYLYPTKALAQDQARSLHALGVARARPAIYDGDTPREQRAQIRRRANVILTNPDMLHLGVLPNHRDWADVFANLAVVVVDEAHVYRGVFGSHVANVLRRLRRIAGAYRAEPRFLLASATIANPVELAEKLTGLDEIALVDRDGAPGARGEIAMWNPPLTDEALGTRASSLGEAAEIVGELARRGVRTICFIKSRKAVELVARMVGLANPKLKDLVVPYRAGYTPQQRRELEGRLMRGA